MARRGQAQGFDSLAYIACPARSTSDGAPGTAHYRVQIHDGEGGNGELRGPLKGTVNNTAFTHLPPSVRAGLCAGPWASAQLGRCTRRDTVNSADRTRGAPAAVRPWGGSADVPKRSSILSFAGA
ncbi:hypothetical protein KRM28CT15_03910 [Krasilnikovia sp. M28-CT-15]